jgi:hypothetical protein
MLQAKAENLSLVAAAGMEWGQDGRWIEPWDEAAALETCNKLLNHWHG